MMDKLKDLWQRSSNHRIVFTSMLVAIGIVVSPLQHYMTLARFEKYGLAIGAIGVGYVLQLLWSWRGLTNWSRLANSSICLFFLSVAAVFYQNPWLDSHVSVQSDARLNARYWIVGGYCAFALIIGGIWVKALDEDARLKKLDTKGDGTDKST
jgi:hypothetical protein